MTNQWVLLYFVALAFLIAAGISYNGIGNCCEQNHRILQTPVRPDALLGKNYHL